MQNATALNHKIHKFSFFAWLIFFLVGLALFSSNALLNNKALAQPTNGQQVEASLIAEYRHIRAGEPFWLAIHQEIAPNWHVYWRNPGDSGLETRVKWHAPEGFEFSDLQFPAPHKIPYFGLMNFGYENRVTYLVQVVPPAQIDDSRITINADVEWLVCKEICIPENANLSITLPVGTDKPRPTVNAELFEHARQVSPRPAAFSQRLDVRDNLFHLTLENFADYTANADAVFDDLYFFPNEYGFIDYQGEQNYQWRGRDLIIQLVPAQDQIAESYGGVLVITENGQRRAFDILSDAVNGSFEKPVRPSPKKALAQNGAPAADLGLFTALLFAFLGGLILNLMPCVFPVLSIKALGLVQKADKAPAIARLHGLSYLAGVVISFLILAGLLLALKAGGEQIGWGFQLQSPIFVGFMALLFFAFGLSLFGLFHVGGNIVGFGQKWTQNDNLGGTFGTGVLATIVATPCTAPFMAPAMGFALTLPVFEALLIFAFLGIGLAFPYVAIATAPPLARLLPKPGAWMESFKQFMAFPMWAAAIWLVWVLNLQTGSTGLLLILSSFLIFALAIWLFNTGKKWLGGGFLMLSLVLPLYLVAVSQIELVRSEIDAPVRVFSSERLDDALAQDRPVFVNMTAAWCITCKANERIAIDQSSVVRAMLDKNILYLKGDWTNRDAEITAYLEQFGRSGVPLYVLYPGQGREPVILPQLLTPSIVLGYFDKI